MNAFPILRSSLRTPHEVFRQHGGGAKFLAAVIAQAIGSVLASLLLR